MTKSKQYIKEYHEAEFEKKWGTLCAIIACILLGAFIILIYPK
jgi:hypothetical protein